MGNTIIRRSVFATPETWKGGRRRIDKSEVLEERDAETNARGAQSERRSSYSFRSQKSRPSNESTVLVQIIKGKKKRRIKTPHTVIVERRPQRSK